MKPYFRPVTWAIGALGVASLLEIVAIFILPFRGYDSFSHIFWIGEWHRLWDVGIFYPRWLPDSFQGFGAPSFYFYPPLTFFLSSALDAILPALRPETIGKTLGMLAFAFSMISMGSYLRWRSKRTPGQSGNRSGIVLGALLYTFAPYRIFNYSIRGALPEHLALGFVPFVFWGADLVMQKRQPGDARRGIAVLIASLSLLLLTNLPAAGVTGMGIFFYVLIRTKKERRAGFLSLLFAATVSVLLTAFYLLPIAAMFGDVQLGRLWRPASIVLSSPFLAIFSGLDLTINSYALLSLAGACILLAGYWRTYRNNAARMAQHTTFFWLLVLIVFLQFPFVSQFLFYHVPPFTIVQLSYRFAILTLVILSIAWQGELVTNTQPKIDTANATTKGDWFVRHCASLVVLLWSVGSIGLVSLELADVHIHRHDPLPIGEAPEYATRWARPYDDFGVSLRIPFPTDSGYALLTGEPVKSLQDKREPYSDTINYQALPAITLVLRRSYWPTWKASLDGASVATAPDSLGRLTIAAPAGRHRVTLSLATEQSATIGAWISVGTLVILCLVWIII